MNNSLDIKKASKCLKESFYIYPIFTYLFPDINNREKKLKAVFTFLIKLGIKKIRKQLDNGLDVNTVGQETANFLVWA